MDSDDEGSYYGSSGEYDEEEDFSEDDSSLEKKSYKTLNEEEIKKCVDNDISKIMNTISVNRGAACALLRHYSWRVDKVQEQWFEDEDKVRRAVGLFTEPDSPVTEVGKNHPTKICNICFDEIKHDNMFSTACGHMYCKDCWNSYISISITDGPGCLKLHCPQPSCKVTVDSDMIDLLASNEDKVKYYNYLYRSYVEDNNEIKWCPAPGCDNAVKSFANSENYDVVCDCSFVFCWNGCEERHRPVDCDTVRKWIAKNCCESENSKWILAYTKPCPKCKLMIEKNDGCNHMTCRCGHEYCWYCFGAWKTHSCNRDTAEIKEEDGRKEIARKELQRYMHYYERWAGNKRSMDLALVDLDRAKTQDIRRLEKVHCQTQATMQFVVEAWEQIVECRRVLRWTYAYGFYIPRAERQKVKFFEHLQGEAESALEKLHDIAENEIKKYIVASEWMPEFDDFRIKLIQVTKATKSYFENLVRGLENGLSEVENFNIIDTGDDDPVATKNPPPVQPLRGGFGTEEEGFESEEEGSQSEEEDDPDDMDMQEALLESMSNH